MSVHGSPRPASSQLDTSASISDASASPVELSNGVACANLRAGLDDHAQFQFIAGKTGSVQLAALFSMSEAAEAEIALRVDALEVGVGDDPAAALVVGTVFYYSTQNNALLAAITSEVNASLAIDVVAGNLYAIRLNRIGTDVADTHPGDMRVLIRGR